MRLRHPRRTSALKSAPLGRMNRYALVDVPGEARFKVLAKMVITSFDQTDFFGVCTQMAFLIMAAFLPTALFIILFCSTVFANFPAFFLEILHSFMPTLTYDFVSSEIRYLLFYITEMRVPIIVASAVMGTLCAHTVISGINQTYGFAPYRLGWTEWIKSFVLLIVLCLSIIVWNIWFNFTDAFAMWIVQYIPNEALSVLTLHIFKNLCGALVVFMLLTGIYMLSPQPGIRFREAVPGVFFSLLGILIIFRIYVIIINHSVNYLRVYGSLSGLFILLTALFFLSAVLNLGAKVNVFWCREI